MRAGKTREAIPSLRQALKLDPSASLIRVQLAGALQEDQSQAGIDGVRRPAAQVAD